MKLLIILFVCLFTNHCGDLTDSEEWYPQKRLTIRIVGTYESSSTSKSLNFEPFFHTYNIKEATLKDDEDNLISILDSSTKELRVSNRPQIFIQYTFEEGDVGKIIKQISIDLDANFTATSRYKENQKLTLATSRVELDTDFTVGKYKEFSYVLKIKWRETVERNLEESSDNILPAELILEEDNFL